MTISGIGFQTSNLQAIAAQNAFKKAGKVEHENSLKTKIEDEQSVKVSISSKNISTTSSESQEGTSKLDNDLINKIRKIANNYNITEIEDNEIKDALKFGTSILADYTA